MRFGVIYSSGTGVTDPATLLAVARRAEECGFESFYMSEHVALYPGAGVLRLLWAGDAGGVGFEGEFWSFSGVCSFPKPVTGSLPIHVGGSSAAAARRAGLRGDGWFPGGRLTAADRTELFALARTTGDEAGRDGAALEQTRWASPGMSPADVEAQAADGVGRLVVFAASADDVSAFADRLM